MKTYLISYTANGTFHDTYLECVVITKEQLENLRHKLEGWLGTRIAFISFSELP